VRTTALQRLGIVGSLVFIADFASKQWALQHLPGSGDRALATGFHLAVVNNTRLAWGLETGGIELQLTAIVTVALAAMVVRICDQLTEVDGRAPAMLGLLLGAGAANLADALVPPHGVVDFIAFTSSVGDTTTFNVADLALGAGLALSIRTAWLIIQTMRGRRVVRVVPQPLRGLPVLTGAPLMRQRLVVSGGHALLAMCAFVWLYSMLIVWTPDAGRSAPNSLLCGVGVFAIAFLVSQARLRVTLRRQQMPSAVVVAGLSRPVERLVLDGSLAMAKSTSASRAASDRSHDRVSPRIVPPGRRVARDVAAGNEADREGDARSDR
jgi:lipoprotein signal peptidase